MNVDMLASTLAKLRKMATTPEKAALLDRSEPSIRKLLDPATYGGDVREMPKHVWLHGSFNYKDNPKDIDLAVKFPYLWGEAKALKTRVKGEPSYDPYFFTKHDLNEGLPDRSMMKEAVQEGKKRYGSDYKWTKLAGAAGLGLVAGDMLSPKDAEAAGLDKVGKTLFHGSNKLFKRFKDEFIGTGEGAQAYGTGHYLTESETKVAPSYAKNRDYNSYGAKTKQFMTHPIELKNAVYKMEAMRNQGIGTPELMSEYKNTYDQYAERVMSRIMDREAWLNNYDRQPLKDLATSTRSDNWVPFSSGVYRPSKQGNFRTMLEDLERYSPDNIRGTTNYFETLGKKRFSVYEMKDAEPKPKSPFEVNPRKGVIYQVRVPEELRYLPYRDPLDEELERKAFQLVGKYHGQAALDKMSELKNISYHDITNGAFLWQLEHAVSAKGAQAILKELGFDGVSFHANAGRSSAKNYVIFDPDKIEVVGVAQKGVRKYHPIEAVTEGSSQKAKRRTIELNQHPMYQMLKDSYTGKQVEPPTDLKEWTDDLQALGVKNLMKESSPLSEETKYHAIYGDRAKRSAIQSALGQDYIMYPEKGAARVLNKIHTYSKYERILGIASAAAGLGWLVNMASPDTAEAMPLGPVIKGTYKTFQQAMRSKTSLGAEMRKAGQRIPAKSSANERLLGKPLQGSKISGVYQGAGDSRYIHLEDGRVFPTNKESLNELAAEYGTQDYIKTFQDKSKEAQWDQILKSYKMNQKRGTPSRTSGGRKPDRIRILEDSLTDRQGMIGNDTKLADQVLVQDNETKMWWLWPRAYAEPAEAAGLVKIDKAKNTLFTNKGL